MTLPDKNKIEADAEKSIENWKIQINEIESKVLIGIHAGETNLQRISVNCYLEGKAAARPINIEECIDYDKIYALVSEAWPKRAYVLLLETLVVELLNFVFRKDDRVNLAYVYINTPDVFSKAQSAGVGLEWSRADYERRNSLGAFKKNNAQEKYMEQNVLSQIRSVGLNEVPLEVFIEHYHLRSAERVELESSRRETLHVSIKVDFEWNPAGDLRFNGIFNYSSVYNYIQTMSGRTIKGPLEGILDELGVVCAASAKEQKINLISISMDVFRPGLIDGVAVASLKQNYTHT